MGKIIAIHSYKGGTGKTLLTLNLAATYAKMEKRVCVLDMDFRAPSLQSILQLDGSEYWLNDYLNGTCDIKKVLIDYTSQCNCGGEIFVGLANPATEALRDMSSKDRKWEMRALGRLLSLKNTLLNDMELDYLLFDTSPGLQYSSINAIVSADLVLVISTIDTSDIEGTRRMTQELYDLFEKKTAILMNKVPVEFLSSSIGKDGVYKRFETVHTLPILKVIPCFCDVLRSGGITVFSRDEPDHPFTKHLEDIAAKMEKF
ncbi:MAG: MinD/ParA family protein [Candidatus Bathyarchaeota archaeon]|nr:MAG: MinD/ParA family protein [Candidatus Bathyarchaeota archaeon]